MMAHGDDFKANLDRVLAMRGGLTVPSDLARRVVVRTAHLPQVRPANGSVRPEMAVPASVPSAPAYRGAALPKWAAMAASLALMLLIGQQAFDLPAAGDPMPSSAGDLALAQGDAGGARAFAQAPPVAGAAPRLAVRTDPPIPNAAHGLVRASEQAELASAAGQVEPVRPLDLGRSAGEREQMALASSRTAIDAFALNEQVAPPRQVYGPVLEPDPLRTQPAPRADSSTMSGMALTSARRGALPAPVN